MKLVSKCFNYSLMNEYPVQIKNSFYSLIDKIPPQDLEPNSNYTFNYWGYVSLAAKNLSYYSQQGQVFIFIFFKSLNEDFQLKRYLNASSLLNSFFREMFFWRMNKVSTFMGIYLALLTDDKLFVYYPARI